MTFALLLTACPPDEPRCDGPVVADIARECAYMCGPDTETDCIINCYSIYCE